MWRRTVHADGFVSGNRVAAWLNLAPPSLQWNGTVHNSGSQMPHGSDSLCCYTDLDDDAQSEGVPANGCWRGTEHNRHTWPRQRKPGSGVWSNGSSTARSHGSLTRSGKAGRPWLGCGPVGRNGTSSLEQFHEPVIHVAP
jgi:hypothetical protein